MSDFKETLADMEKDLAPVAAPSAPANAIPTAPFKFKAEKPKPHTGAFTFSENLDLIAKAIANAQAEMGHARKDNTNPHFGSKYADLAAVWDAIGVEMAKQGVAIIQAPSATGNLVTVETMLVHSSGQWMKSTLTLTCSNYTAHAIGSGLTYARRYSLAAMCGIAPDDDDGNAASAKDAATQAGSVPSRTYPSKK